MANLTPVYPTVTNVRTKNLLNSKSTNGGCISDDNIKVYVRVRPPDSYANEIDHRPCLEVTSRTSLTLFSKPDPKVFTYDQVADPNTTQEEVFTYVAKKIIDGCLEGYNGTIFAYGQTGSGKTFTMLGPVEQDSFDHELRGVIPRGFEYLFNLINREKEKLGDKVEFLCQCSFLEIYNEQIFDLLDPTSTGLQLREDIKKGVFVDGLLEKSVSSARDVYNVLNSGWLNRRVASTSMNRESSRSHAVFTITIESKETKGTINNIKVSRLHLVDLAGSERQKDTQTEGVRLKEAGSINKSLSALGNVIMALVDITHGKQRHVPYRDSKLTFLLRDSLGGNARTHIIANVHPSARCFGETLSTLNFARRAKLIKNKAIVNEDTSGNVASLQEEIRKLKILLQQARAGLNTTSPSRDGSISINDSSSQSTPDNVAEKAVTKSPGNGPDDWKQMMLTAINLKEKSEQEKQALETKVKKLEELCKKKDKFLQSTKMILKFRDAHIAKLEKTQKKNDLVVTADERDKEVEILREEIKILEEKVEHHPDVTKYAMENLELRGELNALRSKTEAHYDLSYDLSKTRFYAMQLERKLRDALNTPGSGDLEKSLSSSLQSLEASNAELERYKSELTQVQGHLESVKEELHQTREDLQYSKEKLIEKEDGFRKKILESDAEIESSKKTIAELQRTLETLQLKTAIERTTLNDVHMQAIRTLSSPRSFSTPRKKRLPHPHNTSGILDEQPPNGVLHTRRDSYNDLESELEESFFKYEPGSPDDEELYQETLFEELKQLQDMYNAVLQEKQNDEAQRIKLNQVKNKLEHQVQQLNEFLSSERTRFGSVEAELNKKVIALNDQLKEGLSENTILKSENEDLKVCLQQADRQIDSLKKDRDMDKINTGRKAASLESKICTLEIELSNTKNEMEETVELNQNLQTDIENVREELQFKNHKLSEWENLLLVERNNTKTLEDELESCLEKLHVVTETNEKLITEAGKQQQLIAALEQCVNLKDELQRSNALCEEQGEKIISLNKKLSDGEELVSELKRKVQEEENYRIKLLDSVKELKACLSEKESKITSLESVIEEKKDKIEELTSDLEKKESVIAKLKEKLGNENEKRELERETFQNEIAALKDELLATSEHCRELTRTLEEEQQQFGTLQCELKEKSEELFNLNNKLIEIAAMQPDIPQRPSDQGGHETSIVNTSLLDQSQLQEIKKREVKVQKVLESYETTFREQAQELQNYKTKIKLLEEKTCFEDKARELEIQLENLKTDVKEKEVVNAFEMKQLKDRVSVAMSACDSANKLKDEAVQVKLETEKKLAEVTSKVLMAEEDCAANYDSVVRLTEKLKEYHEKEDEWKERFGREMEAKTKLEKVNKELEQKFKKANADNARLAGHQNLKQKIQYINDMKKDYQLLKEGKVALKMAANVAHLNGLKVTTFTQENQKLNAKYQKLLCEKSEENRKPLTIKNENV